MAERRLWPRALLTPFTDRVRLAPADERAYTGIRRQRAAQGLGVVYVGFERPREATAQDRREPGE